ncbi:MAG: ParB/RepB/Spo0J family partition protein [Flavobacteriales bacterium]
MSIKKPALGRGLSALLESAETDITSKNTEGAFGQVGSISMIPVSQIVANPFQPRTHFEKEALIDLTNSIKEHGIIQPITLRKTGVNTYQIISGERRFKASQIAGLTEVPAYIRVANDQAMLEMAIVENIQRENLNAIEIALSFQRLIDECGLTQEELSDKVGKDRSTVTNYLRLLKLPEEIQIGIRDKKISMGHARAILGLKTETEQIEAYRLIVSENLSVRKAEEIARKTPLNKSEATKSNAKSVKLNANEKKIKEHLSFHFNSPVDIKKTEKGEGKIVISFNNDSELNRLFDLLQK